MYWLYNKIKAQEKTDHNTKQGSSLWVNLVDVEQLLEDASVRNGRCGSDPLRWRRYSDVGFTQPTWVLAFAEKVAMTIRNFIMLACYLSFFFHYKYFKRERFHLGGMKYVWQLRATFYSFSCECKWNPNIFTMDQFKLISAPVWFICLSQQTENLFK